jgi:hypothetical protein
MPRYLVIHTPRETEETAVHPPSNVKGLAAAHGGVDASPRWLRTWSPDLSDDRIFSLWDAKSSGEIRAVLEQFGFLNTMEYLAFAVTEWGPAEVLRQDKQS